MTESTQPIRTAEPARRRRPALFSRHPWLWGVLGLVLVATAITLQAIGIVQASAGNWQNGTLLAWIAIGVSVGAFIVGLATIIRGRSWRIGLLVMITALLANPYLLARLLDLFG